MRVLLANKYWFLRGGAERAMFDERALLESRGHEAVPFAMADERNERSPWERYFVSPVQTERVRFTPSGLKTAARFVYSFESRRKFAALLDAAKPDVVHLHNVYHQLSPSIVPEAARRGLPVVMTAHDYALVAPNYSLYHDGAICERTKPHRFGAAIGHRCVKGSLAASALEALAMSVHRALKLWRGVDRIIAPSRFSQALLAEYGIPAGKIVHVPHAIDAAGWTPTRGGGYALYVGRLSPEKGVETLLRAAALRPDVPLHVVGSGPDEQRLRALAAELRLANVTFRGWLSGGDLRRAYYGARFLVVPSEWYEVFGLIVLEAYAAGKPVAATQIGGLAELVRDGETGLLHSAGDVRGLAENMGALWDAADAGADMGMNGREWVRAEFGPEQHYARLSDVYEQAKRAHR